MSRRLLIVGAGTIGRIHAAAAEATGEFRVTAIVDPSEESARELVSALGHPALIATKVEDVPSDDVDIAAICTPSGDHVLSAGSCLDRGWHVLVEKPLDPSLKPARAFLEVAQRAEQLGLLCSVVSQHRFDPASVTVRDLAQTGRLGKITGAVASLSWWRSQAYYDSAEWRGTWAMDGGGAVMNQGIHTVDLLVWLLGQPRTISAASALLCHDGIEVEDTAGAVFTFESGAIATFHATTSAYPGVGTRLLLIGDRGSAIIEDDELVYLHEYGAGTGEAPAMGGGANQLATKAADLGPVDATVSYAGHARQYLDIAEALRTGRAPGVTVADAVRSLAAVHAVYAASVHGTVSFDDVIAGRWDGVRPVYTDESVS